MWSRASADFCPWGDWHSSGEVSSWEGWHQAVGPMKTLEAGTGPFLAYPPIFLQEGSQWFMTAPAAHVILGIHLKRWGRVPEELCQLWVLFLAWAQNSWF